MPTVESPGGTITADLSLRGTVQTLAVSNGGRQLIKPSPLRLTDPVSEEIGADEEVSIVTVSRRNRRIDRAFSTITGKRRDHAYRATESVFSCDLSNGQRLELYVRVSADGTVEVRRPNSNA